MRSYALPLSLLLFTGLAACNDEETPPTCVDVDGDGYSSCDEDCDDEDASIHPDADELCNGLDDDCDDEVDEGLPDVDHDGICDEEDEETCDGLDNNGNGQIDEGFPDTDGDGRKDCVDEEVCNGADDDGDGQVDEGLPDTDGDGICDEIDAETCDGLDNDGDGEVDEDFLDNDGDGIADCVDGEDCDGIDNNGDGDIDEGYPDTDADGFADCIDKEDCDGLDNDGDGEVDEDFPDTDGDGTADCMDPEICNGDDDNGDGRVDEGFPDTDRDGIADCVDTEECDGLDNDGDGRVDEDYPDSDSDGTADCIDAEDCDGLDNDGDGEVDEDFPDTDGDGTADCMDTEECDGLDNDGDGTVDEGYPDTDGDGVADCVSEEVCDGVDNDGDGEVDEDFPDTDGDGIKDCLDEEECDGLDNDGDGTADEGYPDTDGDGVADCIDNEECDGLDNDGDGEIDEGVDDDADADGYSICDGDCDDEDASVHPGASESQNEVDDDCDDFVDEDWFAYGDIIVTEITNDPVGVSDAVGEWFEVYNTTTRNIYMDAWTIYDDGGQSFTVGEYTLVPAGQYLMLAVTGTAWRTGGVAADYVYDYSDFTLDNTADEIWLEADSVVMDGVEYSTGSGWDLTTGYAQGLDPYYYDADENDDPANWCPQQTEIGARGEHGTPGSVNEMCTDIDHDGDGYTVDDGDCDDENPATYPGAPDTQPGVDDDCDGIIENTAPIAVAEVISTGTASVCEEILLDGTDSYDPDGDPIVSYDWTLESAPSGSILDTTDIDEETEPSPVFVPDEVGTFTFGLVVGDGTDLSDMDTVSVSVAARGFTNHAPTANAGPDGSYDATGECTATGYGYLCGDCTTVVFTLDGTGSDDADGDTIIYEWTILSGDTYATLQDEDTDTPSLVVSGVPATYGKTDTQTIEVEVYVRDCEGDGDTDTVIVTYDCTGE